jgi:hypothetical protein
MSAYCKGICCKGYEIVRGFQTVIYQDNVKRCRTCDRYMNLDSNRCPCCKQQVTAKSRRYKRITAAQVC